MEKFKMTEELYKIKKSEIPGELYKHVPVSVLFKINNLSFSKVFDIPVLHDYPKNTLPHAYDINTAVCNFARQYFCNQINDVSIHKLIPNPHMHKPVIKFPSIKMKVVIHSVMLIEKEDE